MGIEAEIAAGARRELDLVNRPFLACLRLAADFRGGEGVEGIVIGRVDRDELSLEMGGKLGDFDAVPGGSALQFIAIGLALGRLPEVDQARVPGGNLHSLVTERRRPAADRIEAVEGRLVADELRQVDRRSLDRFHRFLRLVS
jgi:hypothetical protein